MTELYRGKRLAVEKREYKLPNGKRVERVSVHPGNAVAMLPFFEDGSCCLIRQFRFVVGEFILEAPAGTLEPGEDPASAAHRELIEETGFDAETLVPRGWIYTTPGSQTRSSSSTRPAGSIPRHSTRRTRTRSSR